MEVQLSVDDIKDEAVEAITQFFYLFNVIQLAPEDQLLGGA